MIFSEMNRLASLGIIGEAAVLVQYSTCRHQAVQHYQLSWPNRLACELSIQHYAVVAVTNSSSNSQAPTTIALLCVVRRCRC
jgi:hypothetical protein